ncbi:BID domain-containing T4SS effector [Bartonella harrusi]|uniref:BID domain-containing T4SS effector n=1 Tax=Bartonella harrusi TaxID=2961895 RepID=A0ABY5ERR1_9HYPH|nr:BID domain-containing T4SS effector [Bartonella harrusi]UTO28079.1 BID domain-containing T4SS effector [Bartonella harrusi]
MKKRAPSSKIEQLMAKFEESQEQSTAAPIAPQVPQEQQEAHLQQHPSETVQESVIQPSTSHAEDMQKNTPSQESEVLYATPTPQRPPRPPRAHERGLSSTTTQNSQTSRTKVSPQRPSRARDKELSSTSSQESEILYATPTRRKTPRARDMQKDSTSSQESEMDSHLFQSWEDIEKAYSSFFQESKILYPTNSGQKPSRARDMQKDSTSSQESETLYATPTRQKTPHARDMQKDSTSSQESETLYATPTRQKTPHARDMQKDSTSSQESKMDSHLFRSWEEVEKAYSTFFQDSEVFHPTNSGQKSSRRRSMRRDSTSSKENEISPEELQIWERSMPLTERRTSSDDSYSAYTVAVPKTPPLKKHEMYLSEEEILSKVRNHTLVIRAKETVKELSQTVYGNSDIFGQKLAEIDKNPALGEGLSRQVAARPKLVGPLAGHSFCGLKSKARKNAENNVPELCRALGIYTDAVKHARYDACLAHNSRKRKHQKSINQEEMAESLQNSRKPEQEITLLSQEEITHRMSGDTSVRYCHAEIAYWCTVVYGNPSVLQYRIEEVEKAPAIGEQLAWQVENHPLLFGKLAGRNVCGLKNKARKEAENALPCLKDAIEAYTEALQHAKENIIESHQQEQQRYRLSRDLNQDLQQTLIPKKEVPHLTREETLEKVKNHTSVQSSKKAIETLCKVVYGRSHILEEKIEMILKNPLEGKNLASQIMTSPQSIARLAGLGMGSIMNDARTCAKENIFSLHLAIRHHTHMVERTEKDILQDHHAKQKRCEKSVEMPGEWFGALCSLTKEQQQETLSQSFELRKEVKAYKEKIDTRLSESEHEAIKGNNGEKLAKMIGISVREAQKVIQVVKSLEELQQSITVAEHKAQNLHLETRASSAIKAEKVTQTIEQEKAIPKNVQPRKVEHAKTAMMHL